MFFQLLANYSVLIAVGLVGIGVVFLLQSLFTRRGAQRIIFFWDKRERLLLAWKQLGCGVLALMVATIFYLVRLLLFSTLGPVLNATPSPTLTATPTVTPLVSAADFLATDTPTPLAPTAPPAPTLPLFTTPGAPLPLTDVTPGYPVAHVTPVEQANLTPGPDVIISPLKFGSGFEAATYEVRDEDTSFSLAAVKRWQELFGIFTYIGMAGNLQWTNVWYRDNTLLFVETLLWDGGSAGYGYVSFNPGKYQQQWAAGTYRVDIYVGRDLYQTTEFEVTEQ
jgi:hypothetical protein